MHDMAALAQRANQLGGNLGQLPGLRIVDDENALQDGGW